MVLEPVGNWNVSKYAYAVYTEAGTMEHYSRNSERITVDVFNPDTGLSESIEGRWRFFYGVEGIMNFGSGIFRDGRIIHLESYTGSWVGRPWDYYDGDATFAFGYGAVGRSLIPYEDAAVGPSFRGGWYFIPAFSGAPGGGYFHGIDGGGEIRNGEIDIFTGNGVRAANSNAYGISFDIDSTPTYRVTWKCYTPSGDIIK